MIKQDDLTFLINLIKKEASIQLDDSKVYLLETRLASVMEQHQISDYEMLANKLKMNSDLKLKSSFIDALTTNETYFFRDPKFFQTLKEVFLPEIIKTKSPSRTLNLWFAASSTGQEPFSFFILLNEHFKELTTWKINAYASDISERALQQAKSGIYNQLEVNRGLQAQYLIKYFEKSGKEWKVKDDILNRIHFQKINLSSPWTLPKMDIIFMRNVLIYFDDSTKNDIIKRAENLLNPQGQFYLGTSETIRGSDSKLHPQIVNNIICYKHKV